MQANIFITERKDLKLLFKIYYLICLILTLTVLLSLIINRSFYYKSDETKNFTENKKTSYQMIYDDLYTVKQLEKNKIIEEFNFEKIKKTNIVPNLNITSLPKDLKNIKSVQSRKEIFIKITLPLIIKENEKLSLLNGKIRSAKDRFHIISRKEAHQISRLMKEYESLTIDNLLLKVDVIPVSLALAQAVIDGWGTSRFAYEGNALFGQYIWDNSKDGIIPNERESDAKYKIKAFKSLKDSVASYMKNLNTNFHYTEFRINRFVMRSNQLPLSGFILADYF